MRGLEGVKVTLVRTLDEALEFKRWLGERHENNAIAIDTETTGLNAYTPESRIRLIQFGDTNQGWALPWKDWRGLALEALNSFDGLFIYHNVAFDGRWIEEHTRYQVPRDRAVDTMIAAHIIDSTRPVGLKPLGQRLVDSRADGGQQQLQEAFAKHGWNWATVPVDLPAYWVYACLDAVITAKLWSVFKDSVGPGAPLARVFDMEMGVRFVLSSMEQRGVRINIEYASEKATTLRNYVDATKAWCKDTNQINILSTQQLGAWFTANGVHIPEVTPTGAQKIDKILLKQLANPDNGHPDHVRVLATNALTVRKAGKLASSYFDNFVENAVYDAAETGHFIHPEIRSLGARTGRSSVANPSFQNLPKNDTVVRHAVIPREGNRILCCDFDQIEMRLMAGYSGDQDLQKSFAIAEARGSDFFTELGRQIYSPDFRKEDSRRNLIKSTLYALIYGAGPVTMAETAGVPLERIRLVISDIEKRFPGIKKFIAEIESVGVERRNKEGRPYVWSDLGRKLYSDPDKLYALTNYKVQGSAAERFKSALLRLDAGGYGPYLLLPVHDEAVLDIPEEHVPQALNDVPKLMEDRDFPVPLTAGIDGPWASWGKLS